MISYCDDVMIVSQTDLLTALWMNGRMDRWTDGQGRMDRDGWIDG
jgi:hypothetical protein